MNPLQGFGQDLTRLAQMNPPKLISLPESYYESVVAHVRRLEASLEENEQLAFVHGQTGEAVAIHEIRLEGMLLVLEGQDGQGLRTSIVAYPLGVQIAFKVIGAEGERRKIGFTNS